MARRYSKSASDNVRRVLKKRKAGTLKAGRSKKKVTSRKQAIAIGLAEARRAGKKVPKAPSRKTRKAATKTATQATAAQKGASRTTRKTAPKR